MRLLRLSILAIVMGFSLQIVAQEKPEVSSYSEIAKQVKLYPNPAIEYLTVKFETAQAKKATFVLHNIIGSEVETEKEVVDDFEVKIKVKDLNTGFYLLLVRNEDTGLKGAYKFLKK
jgi:hypothetical protein